MDVINVVISSSSQPISIEIAPVQQVPIDISMTMPGPKGDPGYTPIKGIDYTDGLPGPKGENGYTPIKGVDYFDGASGNPGSPGAKGDPGYTPVKGIDYFDGAKGDPGKDGEDAPQNLFVQATNPNMTAAGLWIDTSGGNITFWIEDGE